jgi:hypothetical protein
MASAICSRLSPRSGRLAAAPLPQRASGGCQLGCQG